MIPLFKVHMAKDAPDRVADVLRSGYIGQGPEVAAFEEELRQWFDWPYLATVNSGTSALTLAVHMTEAEKFYGSPLTCTASNMPILAAGRELEWSDINPDTLNMRVASPSVIPLWAGNTLLDSDLGHDTIIDAAHGIGMDVGKMFRRGARFICFSLQAIKHVTSIDGGVILFRSKADMDRAKLLRWYGIDREGNRKDFRCEADIEEWGFKYHMNDVCAAVGRANLKEAENIVWAHRACAEYYNNELECDKVTYSDDCSYWIYSILVNDRPKFYEFMKNAGIMVSKVHERNDKHTCFAPYRKDLPGLEAVNHRVVSIPCGWWVDERERRYIAKRVNEYVRNNG